MLRSSLFIRLIIIITAGFVLTAECSSQTYPFKHYSTGDGLVQVSVKKYLEKLFRITHVRYVLHHDQ